jgi:MoxR-like ATPase
VTVPELGTFTAARPPVVVLTSNRTRDLHDALRRRCLYHWLEFPPAERAVEILRRTVPDANVALVESAARFVGHVRTLDVDKAPGVAEAIDWVSALAAIGATDLAREDVLATLSALAKTPDDRDLLAEAADGFAFG